MRRAACVRHVVARMGVKKRSGDAEKNVFVGRSGDVRARRRRDAVSLFSHCCYSQAAQPALEAFLKGDSKATGLEDVNKLFEKLSPHLKYAQASADLNESSREKHLKALLEICGDASSRTQRLKALGKLADAASRVWCGAIRAAELLHATADLKE